MKRFFGPVPRTLRPRPVARFDGDGGSASLRGGGWDSPVAEDDDDDEEADDDDDALLLEGGLKVCAVGAFGPLPAPRPRTTDFKLK